jgi:hypothetical protein
MRHIFIISFLTLVSCGSQRNFSGYYSRITFWGDRFHFKEDSTFTYKWDGKINDTVFIDSSSGSYRIYRDTVFLDYSFNLHLPYLSDNPSDSSRWEVIVPEGIYGNRPQKLFWRRGRLYYFYRGSNLLTDKEFAMYHSDKPFIFPWDIHK